MKAWLELKRVLEAYHVIPLFILFNNLSRESVPEVHLENDI